MKLYDMKHISQEIRRARLVLDLIFALQFMIIQFINIKNSNKIDIPRKSVLNLQWLDLTIFLLYYYGKVICIQ